MLYSGKWHDWMYVCETVYEYSGDSRARVSELCEDSCDRLREARDVKR